MPSKKKRSTKETVEASYYVYLLIDPSDETVFYVGKGTGDRSAHHAREWRTGKGTNKRKLARIGRIYQAGNRIKIVKIAEGLTEGAAVTLEKETIATFRAFQELTNKSPGYWSPIAQAHEHATALHRSLMEPEEWLVAFYRKYGHFPNEEEKETYRFVAPRIRLNLMRLELERRQERAEIEAARHV